MYSKHWQGLQTGRTLLGITLPTTIENSEVQAVYEHDRPPPKERIFEARVSSLKKIPSLDIAIAACTLLMSKTANAGSVTYGTLWGVHIADVGYFSAAAARLLPGAAQTKTFVENAKEILHWIDNESDSEFADWFRDMLLDTPGIMAKTFKPSSGVALNMNSVFFLMKENWIDDETIRTIMELFSETYGKTGRYLFIPPLQLSMWEDNNFYDWGQEQVKGGQVEKVFAVVHMPGHWGALQIDFLQQNVSFGDSLSWPVPNDTIKAVHEWMRRCGVDVDKWDSQVHELAVPQQPAGSGSCAVNALNAIEKVVCASCQSWTHQKSAHHRLRLLKLVTGFTKVLN